MNQHIVLLLEKDIEYIMIMHSLLFFWCQRYSVPSVMCLFILCYYGISLFVCFHVSVVVIFWIFNVACVDDVICTPTVGLLLALS